MGRLEPHDRNRAASGRRATSVAGAAALLAGSAVGIPPAAAGHDGFHRYSQAEDNTETGYTGTRTRRTSPIPDDLADDGCAAPYTGHPVYMTQWTAEIVPEINTLELGTGNQCEGDYRYDFWGRQLDTTWFPLGEEDIGNFTGTRTFESFALLEPHFPAVRNYWKIDGTLKGSALGNFRLYDFSRVGLESYDAGASLPNTAVSQLTYYRNHSVNYESWNGQDWDDVQAGMSGGWVGNTIWRLYAFE